MSDLLTLQQQMTSADAQGDLQALRVLREQVMLAYEGTDIAAEAAYKIALDTLFRLRDLPQALLDLERAVATRHPFWSAAARISLGLCLYHQRQVQKALFELRKVAFTQHPSVHSTTALMFLQNIYQQESFPPAEVESIRHERASQFEKLVTLIDANRHPKSQLAYCLYHWAMVLQELGQHPKSKDLLTRASQLPKKLLNDALAQSIQGALNAQES